MVTIRRLVGGVARSFPLQNDNPCEDLESGSKSSETYQDPDVGPLPFVVRIQDSESLENVDDAEDYDGVSDEMVVDVPVESQLVLLLRP